LCPEITAILFYFSCFLGGDNWQWGGCSDNVDFGERVARRFIDGLETGEDARAVTNLHNNDVGRKVSYIKCYIDVYYELMKKKKVM
jgi:hypothetical protein